MRVPTHAEQLSWSRCNARSQPLSLPSPAPPPPSPQWAPPPSASRYVRMRALPHIFACVLPSGCRDRTEALVKANWPATLSLRAGRGKSPSLTLTLPPQSLPPRSHSTPGTSWPSAEMSCSARTRGHIPQDCLRRASRRLAQTPLS